MTHESMQQWMEKYMIDIQKAQLKENEAKLKENEVKLKVMDTEIERLKKLLAEKS